MIGSFLVFHVTTSYLEADFVHAKSTQGSLPWTSSAGSQIARCSRLVLLGRFGFEPTPYVSVREHFTKMSVHLLCSRSQNVGRLEIIQNGIWSYLELSPQIRSLEFLNLADARRKMRTLEVGSSLPSLHSHRCIG